MKNVKPAVVIENVVRMITVNVVIVTDKCSPISFQRSGFGSIGTWFDAAREVLRVADEPKFYGGIVAVFMKEDGKDIEKHTVKDLRTFVKDQHASAKRS